MSEYIPAANVDDFPACGKLCLELDDRFVVIVRVDDQFYCLDDVCTHDGGPLGEGELNGFCLMCPRHGAQFDVRTGQPLSMPATEATASHEVKVEGSTIFVRFSLP
jgi:3-phenylpropionate/trans-cinnamate dioxygenase ferredoxin subunit